MPKGRVVITPPVPTHRKSLRKREQDLNEGLIAAAITQDEVRPTRSKRIKVEHAEGFDAQEDPKLNITTPKSHTRTRKARQVSQDSEPLVKQKRKVKDIRSVQDSQEPIANKINESSQNDHILKAEATAADENNDTSPSEKSKKTSRKRKTKEEKEAEAMPLAVRTAGLKMFVGAHVSIAKGLENSVSNALRIGGNAFALFLKSQRKWDNPALKDENRVAFKQHCVDHKYDQSQHVVPHGSYLVNLASPNPEMSKKSYDAFVDDLHRCEKLGIKYYNFHPGSTNKEPLDEAIGRLAGNLNRALAETNTVIPLLENMAGHGSIIGSRFSDLRDIIQSVRPEYRSRIGICIDTCHAFAAGYDLRTPEAFQKTFHELDQTVGLEYLKAMHLNDSKAPFNSHRDLHQNIGMGFLGLGAFHNVMNEPRLQNIPLILETPCDRPDPDKPQKTIEDKNVWAREIKLLEGLIGMDPEGKEFKCLEAELSEYGRPEREKMENSIAVREEKARKKAQRDIEKGQKSINSMFGNSGKKKKTSISGSSDLSEVDSDV